MKSFILVLGFNLLLIATPHGFRSKTDLVYNRYNRDKRLTLFSQSSCDCTCKNSICNCLCGSPSSKQGKKVIISNSSDSSVEKGN